MSAPRGGPGGFSGVEAVDAVATGAVTPESIYADAIRRCDEWEPALGAIKSRLEPASYSSGPLAGLVLGIKDQIDIAGVAGWWSDHVDDPADMVPVEDAPVVARLRSAGATLLGTTTAPQVGAPGGVTPETLNPRNPDRVSGGSSGGSAAAVAAGLVHAALGTDSGGSIRIPAACCGVVGLQATRGLVPLAGTGGFTNSIGSVGPIAASTRDVRAVLEVISGYEPTDPHSVEAPVMGSWVGSPLKFLLPTELVGGSPDPEVKEAFRSVLARLGDAGHLVEPVSLPILAEAMEIGPQIIGIAESCAVIESRLGTASRRPEILSLLAMGDEMSATRLARAYDRAALLRREVARVFQDCDFLVMPTLPCLVPSAWTSDKETIIDVGGVPESRTSALTRLVNPWNLADVPAGSLPIARDVSGSPIGLQIVGPRFSDWKLLDVMALIETMVGGPWDSVAPEG